MPRLRYTPNSPFARKVRVVAHELGLAPSLELVHTALRTADPDFWRDNPLAKVPVWITDDGTRLQDSNVICGYLNDEHAGGRLLPARGSARWRDLTLISLADGMTEAGMLARRERNRAAGSDEQFIAQELGKLSRGLDQLADHADRGDVGENAEGLGLAATAVACSLGWIELRFGRQFIAEGRAPLARWLEAVTRRDSLMRTQPHPEG